jgi:cell division protein FtsA
MVELLKLILLKVRQSGLREFPPGGLVISGGCAELAGIKELAKKTLGGPVRIAYPSGISGLPAHLRKPAYSAAVGLLLWGIKHQGEKRPYRNGQRAVSKSKPLFGRPKREESRERTEVQVG